MRPPWQSYFLTMAAHAATRSTCQRRQVGCVLVRDKRVLATGYNGPPAGIKHCADLGGCLRERLCVPSGQRQEICRALHAEQNALLQAATSGVDITGSTAYITLTPCVTCAKMLIQAGVRQIVVPYGSAYPDDLATDMLAEAGVEMIYWIEPQPQEALP